MAKPDDWRSEFWEHFNGDWDVPKKETQGDQAIRILAELLYRDHVLNLFGGQDYPVAVVGFDHGEPYLADDHDGRFLEELCQVVVEMEAEGW